MQPRLTLLTALMAVLAGASNVHAQARAPDPHVTEALAMFDGVWVGRARMTGRDGKVMEFEQMERIGPMLGGEIRVMEGKGRAPDGKTLFNAFTVFAAAKDGGIEMRSHVWGDQSARRIELKPNGYVWRMDTPVGQIVYDITVKDAVWRETGVMEMKNGSRSTFFEMTLTRQGATDWPAANPSFATHD